MPDFQIVAIAQQRIWNEQSPKPAVRTVALANFLNHLAGVCRVLSDPQVFFRREERTEQARADGRHCQQMWANSFPNANAEASWAFGAPITPWEGSSLPFWLVSQRKNLAGAMPSWFQRGCSSSSGFCSSYFSGTARKTSGCHP